MSKLARKRLKRAMLRRGERLYAWYSAKMETCCKGCCFYRKPDGRVIKITLTSESRHHGSKWNDIRYVGKVIGWRYDGMVKSTLPIPEFIVFPEEQNLALKARLSMLYGFIVQSTGINIPCS